MSEYIIPTLPLPYDLETKEILRQVNRANRKLAELKGVALTIPNEQILISSLTLQEAKDSSEVENIVTTQDDLYRAELNLKETAINASTKEVLNYRQAMQKGFDLVRKNKLLTLNYIKQIQEVLEENKGGFRAGPGTTLQNQHKEIVYTPPQSKVQIEEFMHNLELYINDPDMHDIDPLIKMAIIHHQFESIHPFYDGNGRTGRIINILYLILKRRLDVPILYLSSYIIKNKERYYKLLQKVRAEENWEDWIVFMLKGIEETATETIKKVIAIKNLLDAAVEKVKSQAPKIYSKELVEILFENPYCRIDFIVNLLGVERKAASRYLRQLEDIGLLKCVKAGKDNLFINTGLMELLKE